MRRSLVVVCAALLGPALLRAGVYQPVSLLPCDIDKRGFAETPALDTFLIAVNILKKTDNPANDEAQKLHKRIAELEAAVVKERMPEDILELAADYLRLRHDKASVAKALNLLQPLSSRPPDELGFLALSLQAQAHFLYSTYREAESNQSSALIDYPFPDKLSGLSPDQLKWYRRLEKDYNLPFMRLRNREAEQKRPAGREEVDALFPGGKGAGSPVRFVGESGHFEVGTIAAAEKAKLPPDAIPIVEQLILWHVDDGRLWWLLAELYNAQGEMKNSARVFKLCFEEAKYTNPEPRRHYDEVLAALPSFLQKEADEAQVRAKKEADEALARKKAADDAKKAEEEKVAQVQYERRQKYHWAITGIVAAVLLAGYWQAREMLRRAKNRRKRSANQLGPVD